MKKTILITILLLVVCIVLVGCGKKEENVQDNPSNQIEETKVLTIEFPSNPTTGYNWSYTVEDETANDIIQIDKEYIANEAEEGMTGVGGKQVYTITGLKPGTTTVTFTYARSWEKTQNDKVAVYEFSVDDNLKVTETHSGSYFEN